MVPILFLMQGHEKLSVIEHTRSLPSSLSNGAFSGFSVCTVRHTCIASQRISRSRGIWNMNPFNGLSEALMINIMKIKWLFVRLWIDGFNRHINI